MNKLLYNTSFLYRGTRHFMFFGLTVLCFSGILYVQNGEHDLWQTFRITLSNAVFFFGYAYITIFLLIPEFLLKAKLSLFILLFFLVGIALSALKLVFSDYIFYSSIAPENMEKSGVMNLRFMVVNTKDMTFIVALFCIAKYVKDYVFAENLRKKLEIENKKAKGKLLQSQFDPHFMFNTINNLYALSLLNPHKTREVISRMRTVLAYIIGESQKDLVALKDETELVDNYIQLERLRYGKRLKVDFTVTGKIDGLKIPPMLLFVLVENSFKHGSSLDAGTPWIKIDVKTERGRIILATENSKPKNLLKQSWDYEKGKGFSSLKTRLDIVYGAGRYKISVMDEGKVFKVKLIVRDKVEDWHTTYR